MISFVDVEEARERIKDQIYLSPFSAFRNRQPHDRQQSFLQAGKFANDRIV
jgi:hypothetical protein